MANAKVEIKIGELSFAGEGPAAWLAHQLAKVLEQAPKISNLAPKSPAPTAGAASGGTSPKAGSFATGTLAAYLKEKKATSNQSRKFLATAAWLHDTASKRRLVTSDVTSALNTHNQGRLGNAAQCLINNAKQGFCEKDGKKEFYVTDDGRADLDK